MFDTDAEGCWVCMLASPKMNLIWYMQMLNLHRKTVGCVHASCSLCKQNLKNISGRGHVQSKLLMTWSK